MNALEASAQHSVEGLLGQVLDDFLERQGRGEQPDVEEYALRYPPIATVLRQMLPTLQLMQNPVGDVAESLGSSTPLGYVPGYLGDYRILREVGRGGMGVVYEAEQISLSRKVALKLLPFAAALDPKQLQRFKNEAQAAAQLHHQNIVPVYGVGCERGVHYYAMQYIEGQTLAATILELRQPTEPRPSGSGPEAAGSSLPDGRGCGGGATLPVAAISTERSTKQPGYSRTVARMGVQAAEALEHAHSFGIIHRDIKPANLLVDGRGDVWITDFGLARFHNEAGLTLSGDLLGTLRYMSPEQALAKHGLVDHRTDIYSLGATLYELLTLQPVCPGEERQEVLRQIEREEPQPPRSLNPAIPADLETIVLKALTKEPEGRYATAQELADDLERFLKDEPIRAKRPALAQRAQKWARRHKAATGASACVVCICLFAAGALWYERHRRLECVAGQVWDSLQAARTLLADGRPARARQKLAEAKVQIGTNVAALGSLAAQVETFVTELDRFQQFLDLIDQAHQAEIPSRLELVLEAVGSHATARTLARATSHDRQPAKAVPFLLEALARYEVLERKDWSTALECGPLGKDQVEQIRRTAYEELLWLANDVVVRQDEHRSGGQLSPEAAARQALVYLGKAEMAHRPTQAFYALRAPCQKALGEEAASQADRQRVRKTPPTMALDHYLRGLCAPKQLAERVQAFEAALRLEPGHYWSLLRLGACLCDLGKGPYDFTAAAAAFTGCIMHRPGHAHAYFCRGNAYAKLGRNDDAAVDYSKALELDPNHAGSLAARAHIYWRQGQPAKALVDGSLALKLDPMNATLWNNCGVYEKELGHHEKALADFSKAIELDPKHAPAWSNRGNVYRQLDQYDQALAELSKAVELDPNYALAWINRGAFYCDRLRQYDKAIADFTKAMALDPKNAKAWHNRGIAHTKLGQHEEALADFTKAIELDPKDAHKWNRRGHEYFNSHQYPKALSDFTKAIELDPKDAHKWNNRGRAYLHSHQYPKALSDFIKAIELDPKFALAWCNRGLVYGKLAQPNKALDDFSRAIELDPEFVPAWTHRGELYLNLKQWDKALADFSQVIKLVPRCTPAWYNRGACYAHQGKPVEALADFGRALELDPNFALAWHNRGGVYTHQREWERSVADFSRALELDPKLSQARAKRAYAYSVLGQWDKAAADLAPEGIQSEPLNNWFDIACLWVLKGDCSAYDQLCNQLLERISRTKESFSGELAFLASHTAMLRPEAGTDPAQAVRWAELAVKSQPKCPSYLHGLGLAHYRAGQFERAVQRCRESLDADPHGGGVVLNWLLLAMAERRLGDTDEARRWLDKAVQWRAGVVAGKRPEGVASPPDMPLSDFIEFQVLYPEAEALFPAEKKN